MLRMQYRVSIRIHWDRTFVDCHKTYLVAWLLFPTVSSQNLCPKQHPFLWETSHRRDHSARSGTACCGIADIVLYRCSRTCMGLLYLSNSGREFMFVLTNTRCSWYFRNNTTLGRIRIVMKQKLALRWLQFGACWRLEFRLRIWALSHYVSSAMSIVILLIFRSWKYFATAHEDGNWYSIDNIHLDYLADKDQANKIDGALRDPAANNKKKDGVQVNPCFVIYILFWILYWNARAIV